MTFNWPPEVIPGVNGVVTSSGTVLGAGGFVEQAPAGQKIVKFSSASKVLELAAEIDQLMKEKKYDRHLLTRAVNILNNM